jgi:hypothetical protein
MIKKSLFISKMLMIVILLVACQSAAGTNETTSTLPVMPTGTSAPTITPTPAGAWLSLSPTHGKPGDTIQVEGYSPTPPADLQSGNNQVYTNLCWGGCQDGLQEQSLQTDWSQTDAGHFTLLFVVPSAPWLTSDGPHNLETGDYPISIQYLDMGSTDCANPGKGCMVEIQASQPFYLDQGMSTPACAKQDCGSLTETPVQGKAGERIQVTGWAPLLQMVGTNPADYSGYSLVLLATGSGSTHQNLLNYGAPVSQALDGSITASFQVPINGLDGPLIAGTYTLGLNADSLVNGLAAKSGNWQPVLVASTSFQVTAASAWSQLQIAAPLWIQPSASLLSQTIGFDPVTSNRMAVCVSGAIKISQDGGATWSSISTAPVVSLADAMGYSIDVQQSTACNSVILDPTRPESIYAVFEAADKQYGAPPIYFLGFYTTDGKTWQAAPTPPGEQNPTMVERFGGFWNADQAVQALYSGDTNGQPFEAAPVLVEETKVGGKTWQAGTLSCPANGPCLRWGAAPGSISGMGASLLQFVMVSQDNGQSWGSTGQSVELHISDPNELVAYSASVAALISGGAQYPLLVTQDSGKTWQAYALPSLPGSNQSTGFQFNGLQILPDGSLLAMIPDTGTWFSLPPGSQDWCKLNVTIPGNYPLLLQTSGNKVWWFSPVDQSLQSTPLREFVCGR